MSLQSPLKCGYFRVDILPAGGALRSGIGVTADRMVRRIKRESLSRSADYGGRDRDSYDFA